MFAFAFLLVSLWPTLIFYLYHFLSIDIHIDVYIYIKIDINIVFNAYTWVLCFNTTKNLCLLKEKIKSVHILYDLISSFHDNFLFLILPYYFFIFFCVCWFAEIDILFFTLLIWKFYYFHFMMTAFFFLVLIIKKILYSFERTRHQLFPPPRHLIPSFCYPN